MKRVSLLLAVLLILPVFSCSRHEINSNEGDKVGEFMTFKATLGDLEEMSTRTEFQSSMTTTKWPIYWMPGDAINIFYGNKSEARFETSESFVEKGPVAEFEGYLQAATGAVADDGGTTTQNFWAVYPYNENNTCDGSSVTMTIPDEQEGKAGSFANNLNPTVACSPNMGLAFYNVGGWLVFTVSQENVVSATLQGANGETLVGKVKVSMDENNHPQVDEVTDGKTSITMTPEGGSFEVGQIYCFVILPQTFEDGVILTLEKPDGFKATCEWKPSDGSTLSVDRSKWSGKLNIDKDADFKKEGNIVFADEKVKAICVSKWDTDGDGELSYDEAAAVSEIPYGVFSGNTEITSFEEFQYFTGVTELGYKAESDEGTDYYGAFYGCTNLKAITLPSTLKTVAWGCFRECSALEYLFIPKSVTTIQQVAFLGCTSLEIHMESESPCTLQGDGTYLDGDPCAFGFPTSGKVKAIFVPNEDAASVYRSAQFWPSSLIHAEGWVDPTQNIVFKDAITELICVTLWDTNEDESLSYAEAAAVTDLTSNFQGSEITSFDELKYFTGLTSLPSGVFKNCAKLESLSFPASLTEIGSTNSTQSTAFSGCSKLNRISIPSIDMWFNVLSAHRPFSVKGELYVGEELVTEVTVPSGTTSLPDYYFCYLYKLEKVVLPQGLKTIGSRAFYSCSGLTDINIPETVTSIGGSSFAFCSSLQSLNTSKVSDFGESTFWGCSSLSSINLDKVSSIPQGLFYGCSSLDNVFIPSGVSSIGGFAFSGCSSLKAIEIPDSVTIIYESAFQNCSSLSYVGFAEEGLRCLSNAVFSGCSSLKTISLPKTLSEVTPGLSCIAANPQTVIGWGPFYNSGIEIIECYDSLLERIYVNAYNGTSQVKNYFSKIGVMFLALQSWYNHPVIKDDTRSGVKEIKVKKNSITYSIPQEAFRGFSGVESINLSNGMTSIGYSAFYGCSSLRAISLYNTVTTIGSSAFYGCSSLTSIIIPVSVTSLEASLFSGCSSLTNVVLPESLTNISNNAFSGCSGLTSITIPESVTSIEDYAFSGCSGLTSITIPESVTSIGGAAFYNCSGLTGITIPESVTSIGGYAFYNCSGLTSINIPENVTSISNFVFFKCSGLTSITIPESVTSIGDYSFSGCSGLTSITFPSGVTSIGNFFGVYSGSGQGPCNLSAITCLSSTPPSLNSSALSSTNNCPVYVPSTSVDAYKTADVWSSYATRIQAIVKPFPEGNSFDEDAYITYVANHQEWFNISTDQSYRYDTQFSAGVSGTRIEMKFQIPDYTSGSAILSYGSEAGLAIDASNVYYYYWQRHHEDGDTWYTEEFTPGTGGSVDGAGTVILTTSCDGNQITATVNGTGTTIPVSVSSFNVQYLFSHYDSESGDGHLYEYLAGVPDGAKLYYVKIWNGDNLVYFGHASRAVCSYTSAEEYCWYDEVGKTYTFARSLYTLTDSEITPYNPSSPIVTVRQPFGGGMD